MNIIVRGLNREIIDAYADNEKFYCAPSVNYDIDFLIEIDKTYIESNLSVKHIGDLSFSEAETLIKEKFQVGKVK